MQTIYKQLTPLPYQYFSHYGCRFFLYVYHRLFALIRNKKSRHNSSYINTGWDMNPNERLQMCKREFINLWFATYTKLFLVGRRLLICMIICNIYVCFHHVTVTELAHLQYICLFSSCNCHGTGPFAIYMFVFII